MSREEQKFEDLRRKAEQLLDSTREPSSTEGRDFIELLHELKIHQKELEIQNEELRETQEELSELYSEYSDLYEFAPVAFITLSPKGIIRRINLNGVKLLGKEREILTRVGLISFVAPESTNDYYHSLKKADESHSPVRTEIALRPRGKREADAKEVWIQMDAVADHTDSGELRQWRLALADISDRARAEREVHHLLEEKDKLLREVHHRIKNQMHSITSIISYQASQQESPDAVEALEGIRTRIFVMQSIYDLLFGEISQETIYLPYYIEKLLTYLRDAYVQDDMVKLHSDIADIQMDAEQSFPLGIIINEGVVNAFKYAFNQQNLGNIWVSLQRMDGQQVRILIADDGPGLPETDDAQKHYGFGFTLIQGYANQLDGDMEIGRREGGGTELRVTLSLST